MVTGSELRALDLESIIAQFEQHISDEDGWMDYVLDQSACAIVEKGGEEGVRFLLDSYPTADSAHAQAALMALSVVKPPDGFAEILLQALDDSRPQDLDSA